MENNSDVTVWATAISTDAKRDRRIFWRFAKDLRETFDRSSRPFRIIIAWNYESENGQPASQKHQQMILLEDLLKPLLESDGFAILALVSAGENLREWTYYAESEDLFMDRLNRALAEAPEFPIDIHTAVDPAWTMYDEFTAGVRGTATEI